MREMSSVFGRPRRRRMQPHWLINVSRAVHRRVSIAATGLHRQKPTKARPARERSVPRFGALVCPALLRLKWWRTSTMALRRSLTKNAMFLVADSADDHEEHVCENRPQSRLLSRDEACIEESLVFDSEIAEGRSKKLETISEDPAPSQIPLLFSEADLNQRGDRKQAMHVNEDRLREKQSAQAEALLCGQQQQHLNLRQRRNSSRKRQRGNDRRSHETECRQFGDAESKQADLEMEYLRAKIGGLLLGIVKGTEDVGLHSGGDQVTPTHWILEQQASRTERELISLARTYEQAAAELRNKLAAVERAEQVCQICFSGLQECLVLPCMHLQYCTECVGKNLIVLHSGCPTCRGHISGVLQCKLLGTYDSVLYGDWQQKLQRQDQNGSKVD